MSDYNSVAWFYDRLSRAVFGSTLVDAQVCLISYIPPGANLLIAGGGTGWILEEIAKQRPSGLAITYVEASGKMMNRSKRRNRGDNKVTFLCSPVEEASLQPVYDAVLTPFLFDNFTEPVAARVFSCIHRALRPGGTWLYCDYQPTRHIYHKLLLWSMYIFFRMTGSVDNRRLPDVAALYNENRYRHTMQKTFLKGFITADIWQKE